jgi:hypothetical protein
MVHVMVVVLAEALEDEVLVEASVAVSVVASLVVVVLAYLCFSFFTLVLLRHFKKNM